MQTERTWIERKIAEVVGGENRATLSIEEAGRVIGLGKNGAYEAARRGRIPTIDMGGRRKRVPVDRLIADFTGEAQK